MIVKRRQGWGLFAGGLQVCYSQVMAIEDANQPLLSRLQAQVRACRRCQQAGLAVRGRPICSGPASAKIMIVGQAPSAADERNQRLWSGPAGQRLMGWLEWVGLPEATLRARHYLTAVTRCYPGPAPSGHGDRLPTRQEADLCQQYLNAELALVSPRILIPVGRQAIDFLGGCHIHLQRLIGRAVSVDDTWIVPLPHPSGASLWLNRAEHCEQLARALALLRQLCQGLELL